MTPEKMNQAFAKGLEPLARHYDDQPPAELPEKLKKSTRRSTGMEINMTTVISLVAGALMGGFLYAQFQTPPSIWRDSLNEKDYQEVVACRTRYTEAAEQCIARLCSKRAARYVVPSNEAYWKRTNDEDANCAMACYYTIQHTNYHQSCLVRGVE